DANKRRPDDPEYDARTLYIPESFLKSQSPGLKQWWNLKSKHYDTILLFKVGKFYELYHMDAIVAVKELNLSFMRGEYAHCGFPEIAYGRFADQLVERGYKVARVEQTETPEMMEKRRSLGEGAKEKVVSREICRITTMGTKTYSYLDGGGDDCDPKYLIAICQIEKATDCSSYGFCIVDTAVGKVLLSQFDDDSQFSNVHTLLAEYPPAQILFPRGKLSASTLNLLKSCYPTIVKEALTPKTQFLAASSALQILSSTHYFDQSKKEKVETLFDIPALKSMLLESDPLGLTPRKDKELAISSLGAIIWYLKECLIDIDVLSLKNFEEYFPNKNQKVSMFEEHATNKTYFASTMVMDGVTLKNLSIVLNDNNSNDRSGTLLDCLDTCSTASGKRLLRHWLCNPSCSLNLIQRRQYAVKDLLAIDKFVESTAKTLKQTPDLEKMLQKINTLGSKLRSQDHPDTRAVLFQMGEYNKRKVNDLLLALNCLKRYVEVVEEFSAYKNDVESQLLKICLLYEKDGGHFPDIKGILKRFDKSFDLQKAKDDGIIVPLSEGIFEDYDGTCSKVQQCEMALNKFLSKQKIRLSCSTITFFGSGKNRYSLEVPDNVAPKIGSDFELQSQRKGFKRYTCKELDALRHELDEAEKEKNIASKDFMRSVFASFSDHLNLWRKAVECISTLDVLMSLAQYAKSIGTERCCPEIVLPSEDGRGSGKLMLITGPNMGGKSTLMRQIGCIIVLGQMGSFVPSKSCRFSLVDRIFTRIGASDRLAAGQSTFFVELNETSSILKNATCNSLVILDELGRGTATHDGTAIAAAVLKELAENIQCRTLFSTHYHTLCEEYAENSNVSLNHMACVVENDNEDDISDETITFLYKLISGSCPKSHGFHAAKLAGVPMQVVRRAKQASKWLGFGIFSGSAVTVKNSLPNDLNSLSDEELISKIRDLISISG
uniref:DNA mismatch repair proteins mutS family domain-containing protein n=1 Tax=Romanomermis culicivorax TaxID=13658 RepID=A0A915KC30_ROMCU